MIKEKDWDCLAILDACRFDVFEEIRDYFLRGNLKKVKSPHSRTQEWMNELMDYLEEAVYVSGNPHIRSKEVNIPEGVLVVDVWDRGWMDKFDTIPPKMFARPQ